MAKGFDRLHVKSAVQSHNKINLDFTHLTTLDFGQVVPLMSKELIAGDKFNVNGNYFSRMAPLVRPTYGKFNFKTMSCFVPYHQVAYDVDAWFDGKNTWEGITPDTRGILVRVLLLYLTGPNYGVTSIGTSSNYDFSCENSNGSGTAYFKFTSYGKFVIKVLNSLGYTIPQNGSLYQSSNWFVSGFGLKRLSALPILAFAKAYNDYMSQSQRFNSSALTNFLRNVKYRIYVTGFLSSNNLDMSGLDIIFKNIKLCYENDYFTSAWQWPNSPLNTSENLLMSEVPEGPNTSSFTQLVTNTTNDQYLLLDNQTGVSTVLNQRGLNWLKAFDDWVRRNNYSGSRVVQQIYSRFGIKPDDYRSHYAEVIQTDVMPVQVGDVTATTTATGQPLGDYAGKGIMSGSKGFSYHASDRGQLMVIGWYTVVPMMSYGFDRSVLKSDPLDYYNPEFDGKSIQAISYGEVYTDIKNTQSSDTSTDDQVYGFTELYNEYRYGRDMITGDFRKYDNSDPYNNWHTGRLLTAVRAAGELVAQSSSMNTLPQYDSEFKRIFSVTQGVDPFFLTCQFNVSSIRPILSLNQVPRLGEGDINVPRNGNEIN